MRHMTVDAALGQPAALFSRAPSLNALGTDVAPQLHTELCQICLCMVFGS